MPFINVHAATKYIGSEAVVSVEIDDEEWEEMSDSEKMEYEDEILNDSMGNVVELWTTVTETPIN